jgi:polysaccharide pyruvyl transferase WcaK-like protein
MLYAGDKRVRRKWVGGVISPSNLKNQPLPINNSDRVMKILVVSGDYSCRNMGDVAMFLVTIERLKALWPSAMISVLTSDPDALAGQCIEARPVLHKGRGLWFSNEIFSAIVPKQLTRPNAAIRNLHGKLRERNPKFFEFLIRLKLHVKGVDSGEFRSFVNAFEESDIVVASGQAGLNDHIVKHSLMLLELLEAASRRKKLTAMFSQGIGPLRDSQLIARCRSVLPTIDLITLREQWVGAPFLRSIGVQPERLRITGDDAVGLAYNKRPKDVGTAIGVSLRLGGYAGVDSSFIDDLRPILQKLSVSYNAPFVPVPISRTEMRDAKAIRLLLNDNEKNPGESESLDTPLKVIENVGKCRVVIAGAYHAAVFALSQGIPVVGLANSEYTLNRFRGLAREFGCGCEIVWLGGANLDERLTRAFARIWALSKSLRLSLLEASVRQVRESQNAYRYLYERSKVNANVA